MDVGIFFSKENNYQLQSHDSYQTDTENKQETDQKQDFYQFLTKSFNKIK